MDVIIQIPCLNVVECSPGVNATVCEYSLLGVVGLGTCMASAGDPGSPQHIPTCVWCDGEIQCAEGTGYADQDDCENEIEACAVVRITSSGQCYDTTWME